MKVMKQATLLLFGCAVAVLAPRPRTAHAQAGPPFLTNDPGTPGNANWEINLASMQTITRGASAYQAPQIDLNFGVGDRVQLTYEIPYVVGTSSGEPVQRAWSNAFPGLKWRFLDLGETGWQASVFPQVETASRGAERAGIAEAGPRYLLPVEASRNFGPIAIDFEAGYYLPGHGPRERIFGFAAGRSFTARDKVATGVIALFMAGRSVNGFAHGQPEYMGYLGVQLLLSDYGRRFTAEP
jgi:hypothetical protein